jgi:hypothetical protein
MLILIGSVLPPLASHAQEVTPDGAVSESTAGSHVTAASAWLRSQQDPSGGFRDATGELDPVTTADAVLALAAAQVSDPEAAAALAVAVAYLEHQEDGHVPSETGEAAKLVMAAVAGGRDPRDFAGIDLFTAMAAPPTTSVQHPIPGIYGDDLRDHALALLALTAAREPIDASAVEPFLATQSAGGGWAQDGSRDAGAAEAVTTALVIQAMAASGHGDSPAVTKGLEFLKTLRLLDGSGFASGPADPLLADARSTALVLQALIATGENPTSGGWGNVPLALATFQHPNGGIRTVIGDVDPALFTTLQALPAMAGIPLPVAVRCAAGETAETNGCIPLAPSA